LRQQAENDPEQTLCGRLKPKALNVFLKDIGRFHTYNYSVSQQSRVLWMNPRLLAFFLLFLINQTVLAFPTAKLTIKVIDESGNPVQGADAGINFETPKPIGKGAGINIKRKSGKTDSDGLFSAKGETTPQVSLGASHEGYYPSSSKFKQFTGIGGFIGFRKHEPWNPTVVLVLKKNNQPDTNVCS
jgi:hypothetical protein